jgi:hypothetical protein
MVTTADTDNPLAQRFCHAVCLPLLSRRLGERISSVLEYGPSHLSFYRS